MKHFLLLSLLALVFSGCKKLEENIAEDLVIKAMTDGQWRVTKFIKDGNDVTADFATYKFQFNKNNTVEAINNMVPETQGSWNADAAAKTIASQFNNANTTISLLNGTWNITKNSWTYVEASQHQGGFTRQLRLDK